MSQTTYLYQPKVAELIENIRKVMIGKDEVATLSVVALLAEGHVLLEDVPGVGKTMLVRALAKSLNCEFKRIQFTPDLLPSDVTGVSIYNPKEMQFEFRPGPIMGNIVLADEINRTSPKTQSSLLEGMEEQSVTVDGITLPLSAPFFVMATQNPIEYEGTYPLPEAQLDRFLLKLKMGYPTAQEEIEVLNRTSKEHPINEIEAIMDEKDVISLQKQVREVHIEESIQRYIVEIVSSTRTNPSIYLGVSPRGSISLMKAAKAFAFIHDRDYVLPDDVKHLAPYVLPHRMILTSEARFEGVTTESLVREVIDKTPIPVHRNV